jgi:mannose-6-phosphate isomerase-like protein (cupin superfamily)
MTDPKAPGEVALRYRDDTLAWETLVDTDRLVLGTCEILPGSAYKIHKHVVPETYVITRGTGEVYDDTRWRSVAKGDVVVFKPGAWHCCRTFDPAGIDLVYFFDTGTFATIDYIYPETAASKL